MRTRRSFVVAIAAISAIMATGVSGAFAQNYPNRPITLIAPVPAGSSADAVARIMADKLSTQLAQPVVVVNRVGASSLIGAKAAADAAPDGYTLLLGNPSAMVYNSVLFKSLPYDPIKSFAPIAVFAEQPLVVVANPKLPVKNLADLVNLAKSRKGEILYGATSKTVELVIEYFNSVANIQMRAIPYRGTPDALTALIGDQIGVMFDPIQTIIPHVRSGRVRALAVTSASPSPIAPEIPTVATQGYPQFEVSLWYGLVAPAGTPDAIISRLSGAVRNVLAMPDVKEKFLSQGIQTVSSTPAEMTGKISREIALWKKVAADKGIEPQ